MALAVQPDDSRDRGEEAELVPWHFPSCAVGFFGARDGCAALPTTQQVCECGARINNKHFCRRCGRPRPGQSTNNNKLSDILFAPQGSDGPAALNVNNDGDKRQAQALTNAEGGGVQVANMTPKCLPGFPKTKTKEKAVPDEELLAALGEIAAVGDRGDDEVSTSPSATAWTGGTPSVGSPGQLGDPPLAVAKVSNSLGATPEAEEEQEEDLSTLGGEELRNKVDHLAAVIEQEALKQQRHEVRCQDELNELQVRSKRMSVVREQLRERLIVVKDDLAHRLKQDEDIENNLLKDLTAEKTDREKLDQQVEEILGELRAKEAALRVELRQVTEAQEPLANELSTALAAQATAQAALQAERATTWRRSTRVMMALARGDTTLSDDETVADGEEKKGVVELKEGAHEAATPLVGSAAGHTLSDGGSESSARPSMISSIARLLRSRDTFACFPAASAAAAVSGGSAPPSALGLSEAGSLGSIRAKPHAEDTLDGAASSAGHAEDNWKDTSSFTGTEPGAINQRIRELTKDIAFEEASKSSLQAMLEDAATRAATCSVKINPERREEALRLYMEAGGARDAGVDAAKSVAHTQALSRALQDAEGRRMLDASEVTQVREHLQAQQLEIESLSQKLRHLSEELIAKEEAVQEVQEKETHVKWDLSAAEESTKDDRGRVRRLKDEEKTIEQELTSARNLRERRQLELERASSSIFTCLRTRR